MIAKYGMSYTSTPLDVVKQMVNGMIDWDDVLESGVSCRPLTKTYGIEFMTIVKKAKLAAGLYKFINCLCMTML